MTAANAREMQAFIELVERNGLAWVIEMCADGLAIEAESADDAKRAETLNECRGMLEQIGKRVRT